MKIGIVCYPSLGGSGIVATELGHVLATLGHEVHFITYEVPFRLRIDDHNIFFHQVEINRYDLFTHPDYALPLAVKIASVAEEYALDILHVHYAIPHATSAYLAKQILGAKKPAVITTLHGTDITLVGRDPGYHKIVKYSIEHSDGVTAVSDSLRTQTIDYFNVEIPIERIYNFFIPRRAVIGKKPVREQFVSKGQKLLVHASNFRSVKRPEDVISIFEKVLESVDSKLLLLGGGAGIEMVRQVVADKGLSDRVVFLGKSREVDPYIASADLLLLPSSQESFGLVALEAMAYGVPVVASRVGGLPEVVEDGLSGFLCKSGDVEGMAEKSVRLLQDEALYWAFSERGRMCAQEKFSATKIVSQYLAYYERVLS